MTEEDSKSKERIRVLEENVVFASCYELKHRKDMKRVKQR